MAIILRYFTELGIAFGPITSKWLKIDLCYLQRERARYREAPARYRFIRHPNIVYMPDMAESREVIKKN